jgi:hypothetical protein
MQVVKEGWVLKHTLSGVFMCTQNTTTPKLYVSEHSAMVSAKGHATHSNGGVTVYKPVRAFIVVEGDSDAIPF